MDREQGEQGQAFQREQGQGARTGVSEEQEEQGQEQGQAFQWIDYGRLASLAEWLNLSHDGPILMLARVRGQYKQSWRPAK